MNIKKDMKVIKEVLEYLMVAEMNDLRRRSRYVHNGKELEEMEEELEFADTLYDKLRKVFKRDEV